MKQLSYRLKSEEESTRFGAALGVYLRGGDAVLLSGGLGAGKSVIARGIARSLGVSGPMPSPTFTLAIPYEGKISVCHMDLYRLEDEEAFYGAGLQEYSSEDFVALIEWPFPGLADGTRAEISLNQEEEGDVRLAKLDLYMDDRSGAIRSALREWEVEA